VTEDNPKRGNRPSDAQLLGAREAVADAFDVFFRRHREAVLAYLAQRMPDVQAALDLTAETFAAAYLARDRYDATKGPARGWLFGIARHKAIDALRRHGTEMDARNRLGIERRSYTDGQLERAEAMIDTEAMLAGLAPHERDAVWARVVEDRDYGDIAADQKVSPATVRKRVSQGLAQLRGAAGRVGP
jgi:RNA polymerase sigma factor (sigma-70 family)